MQLILLGTAGCHLCEQAEALIAACLSGPDCTVEHIDIAEHTKWQAQYAVRIPVLLHPGTQTELGWPFALEEVQKFIMAARLQ